MALGMIRREISVSPSFHGYILSMGNQPLESVTNLSIQLRLAAVIPLSTVPDNADSTFGCYCSDRSIGLEAVEVSVGDVGSDLTAYAETVAPWHAKAFGSAQIPGRIAKLHSRPGDVVAKGQVVAELSSRELETLRLSYLQAKNDVALNRKLLEATGPAAREGAVPQQRLEELQNALAQSENDLEIDPSYRLTSCETRLTIAYPACSLRAAQCFRTVPSAWRAKRANVSW